MSSDTLSIETTSPEETERLGEIIAAIMPRGVIALRGDLAAGKTCFVRGMARHFGASPAVHSPTFTLINEYGDDTQQAAQDSASPSARRLVHFDLYRLRGAYEVEDLGTTELFESDVLCAVEWADRAEQLLPAQRLDVMFEHAGEDKRRITIENRGALPESWRERLAQSPKNS